MGFSKLLLSARYLQNGVGFRLGRRLLATEAGHHTPCDDHKDKEPPVTSSGQGDAKRAAVVGVYQSESGELELTESARKLDAESGGKISAHLNLVGSELKVGKAFVVSDVGPYAVAALASYGPKDAGYNELEGLHEGRENTRWGAGAGVRALAGAGAAMVDGGQHADAAAEAAELAAWKFEEFKSGGSRSSKLTVDMLDSLPGSNWEEGAIRGRAQNWARYLSDMPANKMTPVDLAQAALDTLCPLGIKVTAHDKHWIEANHMEAFLAVARGSCEPPFFLECEYRGAGNGPVVLIAAKGVTFDSGGLCLKQASGMVENRGSMAGAAAALAALKALAELKVPLNVTLVVPLCENMISGQCMKVGDVVRALNGLSIQIEDTDMEGRLMLADALVYGQAAHRPAVVIDIATLTHGVLLATGGGCFGCFSNCEALWGCARAAGGASGDRPWRFPLWDYYTRQIRDDPSVDLRNKGSGKASPCIGAAFLKNFVCGSWLHLDTTGVGKLAHDPPPYLCARRMTGRPARALAHTLLNIARSQHPPNDHKDKPNDHKDKANDHKNKH